MIECVQVAVVFFLHIFPVFQKTARREASIMFTDLVSERNQPDAGFVDRFPAFEPVQQALFPGLAVKTVFFIFPGNRVIKMVGDNWKPLKTIGGVLHAVSGHHDGVGSQFRQPAVDVLYAVGNIRMSPHAEFELSRPRNRPVAVFIRAVDLFLSAEKGRFHRDQGRHPFFDRECERRFSALQFERFFRQNSPLRIA
ncbi:MAG: hypothetical protein BWY31_04379 [Lentisphaerae bacterium ADurb.Bin242]|nr:MAG: hypothetical protein BWY31_04379 [Lentisphaerae bacterium ADurb.Bin242]